MMPADLHASAQDPALLEQIIDSTFELCRSLEDPSAVLALRLALIERTREDLTTRGKQLCQAIVDRVLEHCRGSDPSLGLALELALEIDRPEFGKRVTPQSEERLELMIVHSYTERGIRQPYKLAKNHRTTVAEVVRILRAKGLEPEYRVRGGPRTEPRMKMSEVLAPAADEAPQEDANRRSARHLELQVPECMIQAAAELETSGGPGDSEQDIQPSEICTFNEQIPAEEPPEALELPSVDVLTAPLRRKEVPELLSCIRACAEGKLTEGKLIHGLASEDVACIEEHFAKQLRILRAISTPAAKNAYLAGLLNDLRHHYQPQESAKLRSRRKQLVG